MQMLPPQFLTRLRGTATALALSASLIGAMPVSAATIFSDNFDSGSTAAAQNGASWDAPTSTVAVTNTLGQSGCCSLQFTYAGVPLGQDDMAQATLTLPQRTSYWFQYSLYVPTNYYHRTNTTASNNKFLAVYAAPYQTPGFQINLSTEPNGSGGSNLEIHYYNNGSEQTPIPAFSNFITASNDGGKWMNLIVQVTVPTGASTNNGIVSIWKNGTQIANVTNLAAYGGSSNFISQAYFLGWSNSGFTSTTLMDIDNLVVADTPLTSSGSSGSGSGSTTAAAVPDPPTQVSVQ
jgi:hypothetical protein